jgi:hypothetical protein
MREAQGGANPARVKARRIQMEEFRVPTTSTEVELQFADGRVQRGVVFVAASMSVEAWISEPSLFFPFRLEGTILTEIVAKAAVVRLSFIPPPAREEDTEVPVDRCEVAIECPGGRFEGEVLMDTPSNQRRVLDYVNQPGAFISLHKGEKVHLIQKRLVIRIIQTQA